MARSMLFDLGDAGEVKDERINLFEEFKKLSNKDMLYVMLITDYNSPYFQQPIERRKMLVSEKLDILQLHPGLDIAVSLYEKIQYDPLVEQWKSQKKIFDVFTEDINNVTTMGASKQDVERIIKATEMQKKAEVEMERLEEKIQKRRIEETKTMGNKAGTYYYDVYLKQKKSEVRT